MGKFTIVIVAIIIILLILVGFFYFSERNALQDIENFEDCVAQGYPVMESFPRQCRTPDGRNFVEEVEQPVSTGKEDLIIVTSPQFNERVSSPLEIRGEARGTWYFEATFPIRLVSESGQLITESFATAQGEWMTEDFVPFTTTISFDPGEFESGILVLEKSNPSGLPENSDSLRIPVNFENETISACIVTGCSGQICADREVATTCEFREEYACFAEAICERQLNGECGWTETEEYNQCRQDL